MFAQNAKEYLIAIQYRHIKQRENDYMKNIDLSQVSDVQEFKKVTPGSYICRIVSVTDVPDKEYLKVEYDIAAGEFEGYYQQLSDSKGFWGANFIKSYKKKALPFFKAFITAVEKSNNGYTFNSNEQSLYGKLIGLVIGEEEYEKQDGSIATRLYVDKPRSIEEIRKGVEVPALKKLKPNSFSGFGKSMPPDEDVPWN
jgi:hypothetical protein